MGTTITQSASQPAGEITEIFAKVKELLTTDPKAHLYRDDDAMLVNRIHHDELLAMGFTDPLNVPLKTFFKLRREHKITSEHSISRARRLLQSKDASTRGEKYKVRQHKQIDVIDDLRDLKNGTNHSDPEKEKCYLCDGSGIYEKFACNMCNGTGFISED